MSNKLGAFVVGGLVGAAVALLYAPRAGVETRAMVSDRMGAAWGGAQDFGARAQVNAQQAYQTAVERGQSVAQDVAARGQEIYGQAQARVQDAAGVVKPVITDKNDQLREKIEAARQRIAAQVARNAEDAAAAGASEVKAEAAPVVEAEARPAQPEEGQAPQGI